MLFIMVSRKEPRRVCSILGSLLRKLPAHQVPRYLGRSRYNESGLDYYHEKFKILWSTEGKLFCLDAEGRDFTAVETGSERSRKLKLACLMIASKAQCL